MKRPRWMQYADLLAGGYTQGQACKLMGIKATTGEVYSARIKAYANAATLLHAMLNLRDKGEV